MKILFIGRGKRIDYQSDILLHGLMQISDISVYTLFDEWFMYEGNDEAQIKKLYGMGFTITNRIPLSKKNICGYEDAIGKICSHFFDLVIYGCIFKQDALLEIVLENYTKNEVFFIDGEDSDFGYRQKNTSLGVKLYWFPIANRRKGIYLSEKGIYFKRELREKERYRWNPIYFAIPEENIVKKMPDKTIDVATIIPGNLATYIYDNESDYYYGYQKAKFAVTTKKAGWDCLRHYEILANACIPYFPMLEKCPSTTMLSFPKKLIMETNRLFEKGDFNSRLIPYYTNVFLEYTKEFLTTKRLAEYVLSYFNL